MRSRPFACGQRLFYHGHLHICGFSTARKREEEGSYSFVAQYYEGDVLRTKKRAFSVVNGLWRQFRGACRQRQFLRCKHARRFAAPSPICLWQKTVCLMPKITVFVSGLGRFKAGDNQSVSCRKHRVCSANIGMPVVWDASFLFFYEQNMECGEEIGTFAAKPKTRSVAGASLVSFADKERGFVGELRFAVAISACSPPTTVALMQRRRVGAATIGIMAVGDAKVCRQQRNVRRQFRWYVCGRRS